MIFDHDHDHKSTLHMTNDQVMLGAIPLIIPDSHLPVMKRAALSKDNKAAFNKDKATLNKDKGKKEDINRT